MANIQFAFFYSGGVSGGRGGYPLSVAATVVASEGLTGTTGQSTIVAPTSPGNGVGTPVARVYTDANLKVRFGTTTPAGTDPYFFIPGGDTFDFHVSAGQRLYFVEA